MGLWVRLSAPVDDGQLSWTFFLEDPFKQMDATLENKTKQNTFSLSWVCKSKNTGAQEKQKGAQAELHKGWAAPTSGPWCGALQVPQHSQLHLIWCWKASALTGTHLHKYFVLPGKCRGLCVHTGLREGLASPLRHSCRHASSFYHFSQAQLQALFGWRPILRKSLLDWPEKPHESCEVEREVRKRTVLIKKASPNPSARLPAARCVTCRAERRSDAPCHTVHGRVLPPHTASRTDAPPPRTFPKSCRPRACLAASSSRAGPRRATAPGPPRGPAAPGGEAAPGGGAGRREDRLGGRRCRGARRREGGGAMVSGPGDTEGVGRPAASRRAGAAAADGCGVVGRSARSACGLPGDICEVACETSAPFRFTLVGGQDNGYAFYWEMQCLSNVIWSLKCGGRARLGCSWKIGVSFPCSYLLLQYGFINTCLKSLVVDKYGEEIWEKLR